MERKRWVGGIIFIVLFGLLPLVFNSIFTIICFMDFGGWLNNFQEKLAYFIFYFANWPSLLLKIYPYVISTDGKIVHEMLGWMIPRVFITNILVWGLFGFIIRFITRPKVKKQFK